MRQVEFTSQLQKNGSIDYTMVVKDDTGKAYTIGDVITTKGKGSFVLPVLDNGVRYTYEFIPTSEDYWGSKGEMYLYPGSNVENFCALNLSDGGSFVIAPKTTVLLTVPEGSELHLYHRVKFYRPLEELTYKEIATSNGYTTYTYDAPKGISLSYELNLDGYVKKARVFATGTVGDVDITVKLSDLHSLTEKDGYYAKDIKDSTQQFFDSTVVMNVPDSKYLKLDNGENFELHLFRSWQAINSITGNYYVDPDYNIEVISGDSVSIVDDYYAGATIKADSTKSGTNIVKVTFDALDYMDISNNLMVYSKMWKENYIVIVVDVGEANNTTTIDTGINLTEYEKLYYTRSINGVAKDVDKQYAEYTFTPNAKQGSSNVAIDSVRVHEPIGDINWAENNWNDSQYWTDYTAESDGSYTLKLRDGRSVIEIKAGNSVEYYVINTYGLDITATNSEVEKTADGELSVSTAAGAKVKISFNGLSMPIPKLAALYNPGYPDETYVVYSMKDVGGIETELQSTHIQYEVSTVNTVECEFDSPGTYNLSKGRIHTTSIGESSNTHRLISKGGITGTKASYTSGSNSSETINGMFSRLPDLVFTVTGISDVGTAYDVTISAPEGVSKLSVYDENGYKKASKSVDGSDYTYSLVNNDSEATYTYYAERSGYVTQVGTFKVSDSNVNIDLKALDWVQVVQSGTANVSIVGYNSVLADNNSVTISDQFADLVSKNYVNYNYGGYSVLHALLGVLDSGKSNYTCSKGVLTPSEIISDPVGSNSGWICEVNGKAVTDYANTLVNNGDSVVFYYNPDTAISMMHGWFTNTNVTATKDGEVALKLMSTPVNNDGTIAKALEGATVFIDNTKWGTTDENGGITLSNLSGLSVGKHAVTAKKFDSSGKNVITYARALLQITKATVVDPGAETITVTFRLIGDTVHNTAFNGYINWIKTKSYTLPKDSKMSDLFTKALDDAELRYDDISDNYVEWISSPSVLGGYKLSEFTNGKNSGWMYTVNGDHPNFGLCQYGLSDGDEVIWHYVNDYTLETTYENSIPIYISPWLNASDVKPYSGMIKESEDSVKSGGGILPGTTDISVLNSKVTSSNGVASISIGTSDLSDIIKNATDKKSGSIVIEPVIKGGVKKVAVELPKKSVSSIGTDTKVDLAVKIPIGSITLPHDVMASIVSQSGDNNITMSLATVEKTTLTKEQQTAVGNNSVYDISIMSGENAISSFGGKNITVSLPYTLKNGEDPNGVVVWYLNDSGKLEKMTCTYDKATGMASFKTTHLSYYMVSYDKVALWINPFTDIANSSWYYDAVRYTSENGYMSGTSNTKFQPNVNMTRAMLVTVLYCLEEKPTVAGTSSFVDVKAGQWYTDAVIWAAKNNIVSGYSEKLFGTNDNITREQLATIVYNYSKYKNYNVSKTADFSGLKDASSISTWAKTSIEWAYGEELITGVTDKTLDPCGKATRAQVATILMRFMSDVTK